MDGDDGCEIGDAIHAGIEKFGGTRAGMLIDTEGATVFDTQGIERFALRFDNPSPEIEEKARQAYIRWERMHCSDCGIRVPENAMFCEECRPYGFWHWLAYFSPVAWRRLRADSDNGTRPDRSNANVESGMRGQD